MRHNLRPPRPPARTIGTQLTDGFETLGLLLSACVHGALALFVLWLSGQIVDPIFSRWSSSWAGASAWLKHLTHALFN
jgi:hypothetical protein